jgi:hypothetical protein
MGNTYRRHKITWTNVSFVLFVPNAPGQMLGSSIAECCGENEPERNDPTLAPSNLSQLILLVTTQRPAGPSDSWLVIHDKCHIDTDITAEREREREREKNIFFPTDHNKTKPIFLFIFKSIRLLTFFSLLYLTNSTTAYRLTHTDTTHTHTHIYSNQIRARALVLCVWCVVGWLCHRVTGSLLGMCCPGPRGQGGRVKEWRFVRVMRASSSSSSIWKRHTHTHTGGAVTVRKRMRLHLHPARSSSSVV